MKIPKKMFNLEGIASAEELKTLEQKVTDISVSSLPLTGNNVESRPGSAFMYKRNGKCYIGAKVINQEAYENGSLIAQLPPEYRPTDSVVISDRYLTAHGFSSDDDLTYRKSIVIKINGNGEVLLYSDISSADPITMIVIPEQGFLI